MTGEDIIEANRDSLLDARITEIDGAPCVVGMVGGADVAIFWRGDHMVQIAYDTISRPDTMDIVRRTLEDSQPSETYADMATERMARMFERDGIPFWVDDERRVRVGEKP